MFSSRTSHPNPTSLEDLMKLVHNRSADDALKFLKEKQPRDPSGSVGRHAGIWRSQASKGTRNQNVLILRWKLKTKLGIYSPTPQWAGFRRGFQKIEFERSGNFIHHLSPDLNSVSKFVESWFCRWKYIRNIWTCMETRCLWMWGTNPCSSLKTSPFGRAASMWRGRSNADGIAFH